MVRLNRTHLFLHFKFTSKNFQIYILSFGKNFQQIMQILCNSPQNPTNDARFAPFIDPTIHYAFRCLTIGRELSEIPVNQVKFTPFAHKFHKLCKFCTKIHPHLVHYFQISDHRERTPRNWSKSTRFCAVRPQLP